MLIIQQDRLRLIVITEIRNYQKDNVHYLVLLF